MKSQVGRTVRNTIVSVLVLLILLVGGSVVYVRLSDRTVARQSVKISLGNSSLPAIPKPKQPAINAHEGVAIDAVTSPVAVGSNSSVTVTTNATSVCNILVTYDGVVSKDSGLAPKTADVYGNVTWAWTVNKTVPVGTWPIKITCTYHKHSAVVDSSVQVIK